MQSTSRKRSIKPRPTPTESLGAFSFLIFLLFSPRFVSAVIHPTDQPTDVIFQSGPVAGRGGPLPPPVALRLPSATWRKGGDYVVEPR